MAAYWITFTDGSSGCTEGSSIEKAQKSAEDVTGKTTKEIKGLPYPASPRLLPDDLLDKIPTFCLNGAQCAGRVFCPRRYACTE